MSDASHAFEELGLSSSLAAAAAARGYARPTPIQRDAIPLLRRGNNVLLHASAGAGIGAAYGLALLDRLATGDDVEV
ncbi:MAG: DEAD/DEAH box helicase, partial [Longimicrobiales bacterium]